jgi:periplasmic protein TonB
MELAAYRPRLSESDRLGVMTFGSLLVHLLVILGVTFAVPKLKELQGLPTLEITLVQSETSRKPDNPEFLAQANQDGGGDSDRPDIARNPLPLREVSDTQKNPPVMHLKPQRQVQAKRDTREPMTQAEADQKVPITEPQLQRIEPRVDPARLGLPSPADLAEQARLNSEVARFWQEYQKRPRRSFVNSRTQKYRDAVYMEAWRTKVQRIGNLNYPEEAKRRALRGSVMLSVEVNQDGTLGNVNVTRSSGYTLLDDAAVRIVQLAAPFAPFTPEMRAETDILVLTRTLKFNDEITSD